MATQLPCGDDPWSRSPAPLDPRNIGLDDDISMISLDKIFLTTHTAPDTVKSLEIYNADDVSHVDYLDSPFRNDLDKNSRSSSHTVSISGLKNVSQGYGNKEVLHLVEELTFGIGLVFRLAGLCDCVQLVYHESILLDSFTYSTYSESMGVFTRLKNESAYYYSPRESLIRKGFSSSGLFVRRNAELSVSVRTLEGVELFSRKWKFFVLKRDEIGSTDLGRPASPIPIQSLEDGRPTSICSSRDSKHSDHSSHRDSTGSVCFVDLHTEFDSSSPLNHVLHTNSLTPSRNIGVVDHVERWLCGTKLGQYVINKAHEDSSEKFAFEPRPIYLLGVKYDLKDTNLNPFNPSSYVPTMTHYSAKFFRRPIGRSQSVLFSRKEVFVVSKGSSKGFLNYLRGSFDSNVWEIQLYNEESLVLKSRIGGNTDEISFSISIQPGYCFYECACEFDFDNKHLKSQFVMLLRLSFEYFLSLDPQRPPFFIFREGFSTETIAQPPQSTIAHVSFLWHVLPKNVLQADTVKIGNCYMWDPSFDDWVFCSYATLPGRWIIYNGRYMGVSLDFSNCYVSKEDSNLTLKGPNRQEYFAHFSNVEDANFIYEQIKSASSQSVSSVQSEYKSMAEVYRQSFEILRLQTSLERQDEIKRRQNCNQEALNEFIQDFSSRFWFTYRKDMPKFAPFVSTDAGWGCLLRCSQMMVAECYARIFFGRGWNIFHLEGGGISANAYIAILKLFEDRPVSSAPFGVHALVTRGAQSFNHPIGQWFSPTLLVHVLREQFLRTTPSHFMVEEIQNGVICRAKLFQQVMDHPILLLIPLRLGTQTFNLVYLPWVTKSLELMQSVGIIGGIPTRSFYIVGHQDDGKELFYLDPHLVKPQAPALTDPLIYSEYHTRSVRSMSPDNIDPTLLLGFLIKNKADLEDFLSAFIKINLQIPIFSFTQ